MPPTSVYLVWPLSMRVDRRVLDARAAYRSRAPRPEGDDVDALRAHGLGLGLHGEGGGRLERLEAIGEHAQTLLSGEFRRSAAPRPPAAPCPSTAAPSDETSLMRREEMYVYFSCGMRKTVSTVWRSLRFMSAIWNSYSKSDTARMPRTMQSACSRCDEVDEEAVERRDAHARHARRRLVDHLEPLLHVEERLLGRIGDHGHDQLVEDAQATLDEIEVSVVHRIEHARVDALACPRVPPAILVRASKNHAHSTRRRERKSRWSPESPVLPVA